ncbi:MAG: hypothetical protein PHO23_02760 [Candidatus Pacebacteria bacterium]|nr:hypothetical protein [Candidatus Paceibacterota bacterium]
MKFSKILFFSLLFLLPMSLSACSIQTVGLSKDNFLGHEQEVKDIQVLLAQDFDLYYPG